MILPESFYTRNDVVLIARQLLGKTLVTRFDSQLTSGIITETEAYAGVTDRASHAFGGRRTSRTGIMFRQGGTAYVYLCYGIHSLFNVVTSVEGEPHAVLIRSIRPVLGLEVMKHRSEKVNIGEKQGTGPGNVSKLLGIHYRHSGMSLCPGGILNETAESIWIEDSGIVVPDEQVVVSTRIGVSYAGEDALLPYRFIFRKTLI